MAYKLKLYKMKKSDLKSGMYLELENGERRIVLLDSERNEATTAKASFKECNIGCFPRLHDYFELHNWTDDLLAKSHVPSVKKIYSRYGGLIWERSIIPELTMQEAINKIGFEFKIKK